MNHPGIHVRIKKDSIHAERLDILTKEIRVRSGNPAMDKSDVQREILRLATVGMVCEEFHTNN